MAAFASVARYLLDEASSGSSPTTTADDTGNDNDADLNYDSGNMEWTSNSAGNGLDLIVENNSDAGALLTDIATNGNLGSEFDSVTEGSIICVANIDEDGAFDAMMGIGQVFGDFSLMSNNGDILVLWDDDTINSFGTFENATVLDSTAVYIAIVDTTQAVAADRVRLFVDDVEQTITIDGFAVQQNRALTFVDSTDRNMWIGGANGSIKGQVYYGEFGTGVLTAQQITDASDNLLLDNDADWDAPPAGGRIMSSLVGSGGLAGRGGIAGPGGGLAGG